MSSLTNYFTNKKGIVKGVSRFRLFLLLITSTFISLNVSAQCPAGFVVDGNPCDWSNAPAGARIGDPFGSGVLDNQFTQGSKDFFLAADLRWSIGQTKDKNDIANGAAFLDGTILRFAGDRSSNNGDAQIGFWFYINGTGPTTQQNGTQNFAPEHYYDPVTGIGDLLIIANFTNGGNIATVTILKWVGSGGNVPNTNGRLNTTNLVGTAAQNNTQAYPIPSGWVFGSATYETNEFYEGQVDLAGYSTGNPICISTFLLEARSSQEVTASLDDFVGGPFVSKPSAPNVTPGARCGPGTVNLSASCSAAGSTPRWWANATGGSPLFTGSNFTTPSLTQTTTFYVSCYNSTTQCESDRVEVVATVNANPTAGAGPDQAKCQTPPSGPTSFTMAGTGTNGTFAWSQVGSTGTASAAISDPTSLTTNVNVSGTGTVTLRLTTTSNTTPSCGTATDDVTLTVNANPTANAGGDQIKCQTPPSGPTSFTMAGTAANGTTAWTQIGQTGTASANISNPASLTTSVSVSGIGTVTLRLTTTSNTTPSCGTATDDVILTVLPNPTANAGPDQTKCQTPPSGPTAFTMAGTASNGTSAWTQISSTGTANAMIVAPGSLNTTVNVTGVGSVTLRLTTTSVTEPSCGTATDDVTLTVTLNPTANAGPDQTKCQTPPSGPTSFTMAGLATAGTVAWTQISSTGSASAAIDDPSSLTTSVSVSGIGSVTLRLTTTSNSEPSCGTATDDVTLTVLPNPTSAAGGDQAKCQTPMATSFTLSGSGTNGTPAWTQIASSGTANATIVDPAAYNTTANVTGIGTVTLRLTVTSNSTPSCGTATDDIILTVNANPDVQFGPLEVCASECLDLLSPTAGVFSGQFVTFDVTRSVYTFCAPATPGAYPINFAAQSPLGCIQNSPLEVNVIVCNPEFHCTYTQGAYGNAGGNDCDGENTYTTPVLINNLLGAGGMTIGRTGRSVIIPAGSATALIAIMPGGGPSSVLPMGNCNITLQGSPSCLQLKNGRINNALLSQTITLGLNLRLNGGSLTNFALEAGRYLATQERDGCGENATTVTCDQSSGAIKSWLIDATVVNYLAAPGGYPATVGGLFELANDVLGGVLVAGQNGVPSLSAISGVEDAINNAFDECRTFVGWFYCSANCSNIGPDNPPATVNAGPDQSITAGNSAQLAGTVGGGASTGTWTTSGSGTFSPTNTTLNATYTPSAADIMAGSVTLTLTADPAGPCPAVSDNMKLTINPVLLVKVQSPIIPSIDQLSVDQSVQDKLKVDGRSIKGKEPLVEELQVSAFPNPFKDRVKFVISTPVSGQAVLEIYNNMGQQVAIAYKGHMFAGINQVVEYNVPTVVDGGIFYKLRVGDKFVTGKLLKIK